MAYEDNQNESPLPVNGKSQRTSVDHLPKYYRTQSNTKFLKSTIDQLIQPGVVEKVNGYVGRKTAKAFTESDNYLGDVSNAREDYQFEPATVIKDDLGNVKFYKDYNDYVNQLDSFAKGINDHSVFNRQEYYAWNPHIDWDKFANFREYYWLPNGPQIVDVRGNGVEVESSIKVTLGDNVDNYTYHFSTFGATNNPTITLYRGQTYKFEIDTPNLPFSVKTKKTLEQGFDIDSSSITVLSGVDVQDLEKGTSTFVLDSDVPDILYYVSSTDINASGTIIVKDIAEATFINVEEEILGKRFYKTVDGVDLSNGMKIVFTGEVEPASYSNGAFYVEGVGDSIKLISENELNVPTAFADDIALPFDNDGFDRLPFGRAIGYPVDKDYFVINRASKDGNLWSRYNRWFHRSVIEKSAAANNQPIEVDQSARAKRPIIEFEAGLKLANFGTFAKADVDLVDDFTKDVFSTIEGSQGYNIDGVDIVEGMRILFTADTDILVKNRIFQVEFINFASGAASNRQIHLKEVDDTQPLENEVVLAIQGTAYKGKLLYFNGDTWSLTQDKSTINQPPLFDIFDDNGNSYLDTLEYPATNFQGTKLFSYKEGTGTIDAELGRAIAYRSIENVGDILFDFNLLTDSFTYTVDNNILSKNTDIGYLRKYSNINDFVSENGWIKGFEESTQSVVRQYIFDNTTVGFEIDVYNTTANLEDLKFRVYLNNDLVFENVDYTVSTNVNNNLVINFVNDINLGDVIIIKTKSSAEKNENGYYEIPINLERNPLNENLIDFTLGEVNDHVGSIVENLDEFTGKYPGSSNLRDIGNISQYGKRFVQHSAPINLSLYSVTDKDSNLINSIRFARREYAKFKRIFLTTAENLGYDGNVVDHFNNILKDININKTNKMPFFFSDMVALGANQKNTYIIEDTDEIYFALSEIFSLNEQTRKSVLVYQNGNQLVFGKDYTFNEDGFCVITTTKQLEDIIEIYEYENTNGSFVPPTPTKLGLYPKYEPQLVIDDTYNFIEDNYTAKTSTQKQFVITNPHNILADSDIKVFIEGVQQFNNYVIDVNAVEEKVVIFNNPIEQGDTVTISYPKVFLQGHDGSYILAYNDFRDDLLLELEKRIFNNLKVEYNSDLFDIYDFVGGEYRNTSLPRTALNKAMLQDFLEWSNYVEADYTKHDFFERTNRFTFNYKNLNSPNGNLVPGFWRQIYKEAYDTDRPHTHPWEMLGFSIQPKWWIDVYGPAPYTKNNEILWADLEGGIVREPNKKLVYREKFKRPGLSSFIPVNESGKLIPPIDSGFIRNFTPAEIDDSFVFGDGAPVEAAWRKTSEFAFSLITSLFINNPSKVLSTGYDRVRQIRNQTNQIVYSTTNTRIKLTDLVFPNTITDTSQIYTAGLINYIANYMTSDVLTTYAEFKSNLQNIKNQLGFKIGGYTDKEKFRLLLDSRTPTNEGNVFVPDENYNIFLNTSSPVTTMSYSGVIIEKRQDGFILKGYDNVQPYFNFFRPITTQNDPSINIGGISESFLIWDANKTYVKGTNVENQGSYYRVLETHTSGDFFDNTKFTKLPNLPLIGGREAFVRKQFTNVKEELPYGSLLPKIQDVVDFLLGYGKYLESQGFVFDKFEGNDGVVINWRHSVNEFLFWTTQNWSEGSVISVSPGATQLKLASEYSTVDNIFDSFYGYTLLKSDGKKLVEEFSSLGREPNLFVLQPKNTEDGIFAVRLPLVQTEHVCLLDNKTVFGDIIYDLQPGYRQERIKVLGYKTDNWDGSLNIPGFIYDDVVIEEWESWKDYAIGSVVKYKEFYYSADSKISGEANFDANKWNRLPEKPSAGLYSNFDYQINQFADFYDLDSDNFDTEQQRLAQHLIGYQKRNYLENIINDSVSQYKFYQGMIADKGSKNSLTKLFDALGSANKDSLEFYEEWAIKDGQYGAADGFQEVEYKLDESKFRLTPQPIELVNSVTGNETDLVYRILPYEAFVKDENYDHSPFPAKKTLDTYVKNAGYVNQQDILGIATSYDRIIDFFYRQIRKGAYIWVANENRSWSVYKHVDTPYTFEKIEAGTNEFTITLNTTPKDIQKDDVIGLADIYKYIAATADDSSAKVNYEKIALEGFFVVKSVSINKITLISDEIIETKEDITGSITAFRKVRTDSLKNANVVLQKGTDTDDLIWVDDNGNGNWNVLKNNQSYTEINRLVNDYAGEGHNYGTSMSINERNTTLAVGAPDYEDGKVYIYNRPSNNSNFVLTQTIEPDNFADNGERFGAAVSVSPDGKYVIVGSPNASNVLSKYAADYVESTDYSKGSIVRRNEGLWETLVDVKGSLSNIIFDSFASTTQAIEELGIESDSTLQSPTLLVGNYAIDSLTGNYAFPNQQVQHILVRVPLDMYEGSGVDDQVRLGWNLKTYSNQNQAALIDRQPFGGSYSLITKEYLEQDRTIKYKVDEILYINAATNIPEVGDTLQTNTGSGTAIYVFSDAAETVIYLADTNGSFNNADSLFRDDGDFIGEYEKQGPVDSVDTSDVWGGYWFIQTGSYTPTLLSEVSDEGKALVIYDVIPDSTGYNRYYYNSLDFVAPLTQGQNTIGSYLRILSFTGAPGPSGITGDTLSDLYVVRAPLQLTDPTSPNYVAPGDSIDLYINQLARYGGSIPQDITALGLNTSITNRTQTVYDVWQGYISFDFTKFDAGGNPFEPRVGDTVRDRTRGGEAEVAFYQRNGNSVTIFVKNVTGTWSLGDDYGQNAEIEFLGTPGDLDPIYQVDRIMGQIQFTGLGYSPSNIGGLLVFQASNPFAVPAGLDYLTSIECWFYNKGSVAGVERPANVPSATNNEWKQVYKIPTNAAGSPSGLTNEGMYSIYGRSRPGIYDRIGTFIVPERQSNFYLGSQIETTFSNNLYRTFIHAKGTETESLPGRIYMSKKGEENNNTYDWEYAKNKKFRGAFNETLNYFTGDIVYLDNPDGTLYTSKTNLAPGAFDFNDWTSTDDVVDYVGYIPNDTGLRVITDSTDGSTVLDQGSLSIFGKAFDVSKTGDVLVTSAIYNNDKPNLVVVYRSNNGHFERKQQIAASNTTSGFGQSVSISDDGMLLAIGAPYDDTVRNDQGIVYIYKQNNGTYELNQTINSFNNERAELFGWNVQFDGKTLAVTARNADSYLTTTIDEGETLFDGGFTEFKTVNDDSGVVYVYEIFNDTLLFGQTIQAKWDPITDPELNYFGRNLLVKNNHVYVGLPDYQGAVGNKGQVLDYRRPENDTLWSVHRSEKETVDLEKIRKVFLYDTDKKELLTYLDYIDPLQGKIAGEAEQNISFKTHYDPATYNSVNASPTRNISVDNTNSWGEDHVGRVWWDLSTTKFLNPYQDTVIYSTQNWNTLAVGNSVDIYEWVESDVTPSRWDAQADTNTGFPKGYSGTSLYGDNIYSTRRVYDSVSQTFKTKYYFWVTNKKITPNKEFRTLNIQEIENYITDPNRYGVRSVTFISPTQFVINNCKDLIKGKDVALSVQYYTIDNQTQNIHNQYQIISDGLETSLPKQDIVKKWVDSLIGYDEQKRSVPDPTLSAKYKYGVLNNPRQSWFVNKTEALKQVIERVNLVLKDNLIIDDKSIAPLFANDQPPSSVSNIFDTSVDTLDDLAFIGVAKAERASITAIVSDGKIVRTVIDNPGRGYRVAPTITIYGKGSGAELQTSIDNTGKITSVTIVNPGENYGSDTTVDVRRFTVLVNSDPTIQGKWALYERDTDTNTWVRTSSQAYDVSLYWNYIDWYASGFSDLTDIDYSIENSYELNSLNVAIGDIVKINNIGSGGWLLLQKINNTDSLDYTVNYSTIGRQNGTIQFKNSLYDNSVSNVGFDSISFDSKIFDNEPVDELRIILNAIQNNLFIDDLQLEWNKLFFASLRYVFAEQKYVDWAFKTSFIKAVHNVGQLRKDITFNNDNLPSYEDYILEVKPFGTKIREYLSSYEGLDNSQSVITDFDLPPVYKNRYNKILPESLKIIDDTIIGIDSDLETYPNKHWTDNNSYKIVKVDVVDIGEGYLSPPVIKVSGNAKLQAFLGANGSLSSVGIIDGGSGYYSIPSIEIEGNLKDGGKPAKLSVQLGDSPVRGMHTIAKFDRVSGTYVHTQLDQTENFVGQGNQFEFDLKWPMNLNKDTVTVILDGIEALDSEYNYTNIEDTTKGYTRQRGRIEFTDAPLVGKSIQVNYKKSIDLLEAQDRINQYYETGPGKLGKELGQLMTGIDYGGVEVRSFGFGGTGGWGDDNQGWGDGTWDTTYDVTYEDEIFTIDEDSTTVYTFNTPLEQSVTYNVYVNGVRIDDPDFGVDPTNPNAKMVSISGNGQTGWTRVDDDADNTGLFVFNEEEISFASGDQVIFRKTTSDGTFTIDPEGFDTVLTGGLLNYSTATGLNAEDITVDGDGFVTPTTSGGPEELVPGQLLDTVDIQVYERPKGGSSPITTRVYIADGTTTVFSIGQEPILEDNIFVKVDEVIYNKDLYTIDYKNQNIIFETAPADQKKINIITLGTAGVNIVDIDQFVADGSTSDFLTNVRYSELLEYYITIDGIKVSNVVRESDDTYEVSGNAVIKLSSPPDAGSIIRFAFFEKENLDSLLPYSEVLIDNFTADGSTTSFELSQTPFSQKPTSWFTIVKVNNKILNAGYNKRFTAVAGQLEYKLDEWQLPPATYRSSEMKVFINNEEIEEIADWSFVGSASTTERDGMLIRLNAGVVFNSGDIIDVYILNDGEYAFGTFNESLVFTETPGILQLNSPYNEGDSITVYQFSNHDLQGFERSKYDVVDRQNITGNTSLDSTVDDLKQDWYTIVHLRNGLIELREEAIDAQYVWVTLNGDLLTPSVHYYVTDNKRYVKIIAEINENDVIEILQFSNTITKNKFGWRQFKDMLNRNHYKRLDGTENIVLAQDLYWYDNEIVLNNSDSLADPRPNSKYPNVIFIDGERIEYFIKDGNKLKQLRRGTLGTGVKTVHTAGIEVYNQSFESTMPYTDETFTTILTGDGTSTVFDLDFIATSTNEFEVFVAGKRLRKNSLEAYTTIDPIDQDSPEGDATLPAEFSLNENGKLVLLEPPTMNTRIIIVRRKGKLWTDPGTPLSDANNNISRFLRAKSIDLPR